MNWISLNGLVGLGVLGILYQMEFRSNVFYNFIYVNISFLIACLFIIIMGFLIEKKSLSDGANNGS